jgi:hypothetical protein
MIEKPSIIIASLGRTGTRYFYTLFKHIVPGSTSLHEPDVFQIVLPRHMSGRDWLGQTVKRILEQAKEVGTSNLVIRKVLGRWSLIELSDARLRGQLDHDEAVHQVLAQRRDFVHSRSGSVYVESNRAYYGLLDVLRDVYGCHRAAYIVRDARDWIVSTMNWGEKYGKGRIRSLIAHSWPTAAEIEGDPYATQWDSMSRFEKLCWAWATLNTYALQTIQLNPNARLFRFEDIFRAEGRYQNLTEMVQFLTTLPGHGVLSVSPLDGWLDREVHKSSGSFPMWPDWSEAQRDTFRQICGPLAERLGYGLD